MSRDEWIWGCCRGAGKRVCRFRQRHTPPPEGLKGWPLVEHDAPFDVANDRCRKFALRPDAPAPRPC